jgi:hypothetical protein
LRGSSIRLAETPGAHHRRRPEGGAWNCGSKPPKGFRPWTPTLPLGRWLTDDAFAAYRPQLEWLIATGQWAGLLDRFYQILPFGTGGRRGVRR